MAYQGKNPKSNTKTYTPQSAEPTNPVEGRIYRSDGTVSPKGLYEYKDSTWQSVGTSGVDLNYIKDGDAEAGVSNYSTYADAAATQPVDGAGGTANITFTTSAVEPLRGVNSFVITKDAADRQGEGVAKDFAIEAADMMAPLTISFEYSTSTNYVDEDLRVYMISSNDSFVANFNVIEPVPTTVSAGNGTFVSNFQTYSTDEDYRLCFHVASTNASAYTVKVDNIKVEKSSVVYGAAGWKQYDVSGYLTSTATNFAVTSAVAVPYKTLDGAWRMTFNFSATTTINTTSTVISFSGITASTLQALTGVTGVTAITSERIYISGSDITYTHSTATPGAYYISGDIELESQPTWAEDTSNVILSSTTMNREISARSYISTIENIAHNTSSFLDFDTIEFQNGSDNIVNAGVGNQTVAANGWQYVISESGTYRINTLITTSKSATSDASFYTKIVKNYSAIVGGSGGVYNGLAAEYSFPAETLLKLTKDDIIQVSVIQYSGVAQPFSGTFSIEKTNTGSQTIAAEEKVFVEANGNSNNSITANVTKVPFTTTVKDTHSAWSGDTFTAPKAGEYIITGGIYRNSGSTGIDVRINGVIKNRASDYIDTIIQSFSSIVSLESGDLVTFTMQASTTLVNSYYLHHLEIHSL